MEQLENFLIDVATPEMRVQILSTYKTLLDSGILDHTTQIDTLLSDLDEQTPEDSLLMIYQILKDQLITMIRRFSITVSEDAKLGILTKIYESLLTVPGYGDAEGILEAIQDTSTNEEVVCEIVSILQNINIGESAVVIEHVNDSLVDRIKLVLESKLDAPNTINKAPFIERLKAFKERTKATLFNEVLKEGYGIGAPLDTILKLDVVLEELDKYSNEAVKLADEVLGLVLMSSVEKDDVLAVAKDLINDYASDINVITKATEHMKTSLG